VPNPIPIAYKLATVSAAIQGMGKPRVIMSANPHARGGVHARQERDHGAIQAPEAGATSVNQAKIPMGALRPRTSARRPIAMTEQREVNTREG
jgi:hypothetical protein